MNTAFISKNHLIATYGIFTCFKDRERSGGRICTVTDSEQDPQKYF